MSREESTEHGDRRPAIHTHARRRPLVPWWLRGLLQLTLVLLAWLALAALAWGAILAPHLHALR